MVVNLGKERLQEVDTFIIKESIKKQNNKIWLIERPVETAERRENFGLVWGFPDEKSTDHTFSLLWSVE